MSRLWSWARYFTYILYHKARVAWIGRRLGVSWWRLFKHDLSKLRPDEFFPYARHFFPTKRDQEIALGQAESDDFRRAVIKHLQRNDHHWQHWWPSSLVHAIYGCAVMWDMEHPVPQDHTDLPWQMSDQAAREMVADWAAVEWEMSRRWYPGDWYRKQDLVLHSMTRPLVESLIKQLEGL